MTFLVGENGSGKSTLVEGVAGAFGLGLEGGERRSLHQTYASESGLQERLRLVRGGGGTRNGFFLRAETMHGFFTCLATEAGVSGNHGTTSSWSRTGAPTCRTRAATSATSSTADAGGRSPLASRALSFGRLFRLIALVLGAITLVLAAVEVVVVLRTRDFIAHSSTAVGEVIELVPRQSCDEREDERGDERQVCSTVYAPRVRFTGVDGRQIVFVSSLASSSPSYADGDRVDVRYHPDRPAQAQTQIDELTDIWFSAILVGIFLLVAAGLCAVWVVLAVRFRKE